jgi:hypothetical protein
MANLQQLETALRNADAAGDVEAAKVLAGEITKLRAEGYKPEPASAAKRAALGAGEAIVGLGQLFSRPLAAAGGAVETVTGPNAVTDYLQSLPQENDAFAAEYRAQQEAIAPEGVDVARIAGNAIPLLATGFAGGVPTTVGGLARVGAVTGAVGGAAAPVEGSGENFASQKAGQIAAGAVTGAVLTPAVARGLGALNNAAGRAIQSTMAKINPGTNTAQIKVEITNLLNQSGIDTSKLGPAYLDEVAKQVQAAKAAGGKVDAQTLANQAAAKALGIDLTEGQATQNAAQFSKELFLREAPGGEELATQYTNTLSRLNSSLNDIGRGLPEPVLKVDAGQRAIDALKAADAPMKAKVDELYTAAKSAAGLDTPIDGRAFVDGAFAKLEKNLSLSDVPADLRNLMNTVSQGQAPLTIGRAQEVIQSINGRLSNLPIRDPQRVALNTIKTELDGAIDRTGSALGDEAATAFRKARTAAAVRFKRMEDVPALRQALDGEISPDDFIKKVVYQSDRDTLRKTRAFLRSNNRGAWNQIRSQVLEDIRQATTKGSDNPADFSQSAFNKQLSSLRQSGKLGLLFSESEIKTLNAIGRVGRMVQQGPPGVSRTGLSGNAKALGMLTQLFSRITGPIGGLANSAATRGVNTVQTSAALRPAAVAAPGKLPDVISRNAQSILGRGGSALALPLIEE